MRLQSIRYGRGPWGSAWGIVLLLILIGIFVAARMGLNRNRQKAQQALRMAQTDPEVCLKRFFIERSKNHERKEGEWKNLLEFMSGNDQRWFERNYARLAALAPETEGAIAQVLTPSEQQWGALKALLRFGRQSERPVVSTIKINGDYAIAYYHSPGRVGTLQEIFLYNEGGFWKIRRFAGARDMPHVVGHLVEAKTFNDEPLDEDEQNYRADPDGYQARKQAELLTEVGLEADPPS